MATHLDDTNPIEKRPTSDRKVESNRRNAKKSTGPKTQRGKDWSRWNAIKHGLLAKDVSESLKFMGEDPNEFHEIVDELRQRYPPAGALGEFLVQRAALCAWRMLRAGRYENAELGFALDRVMMDEYERGNRMIEAYKPLYLMLG